MTDTSSAYSTLLLVDGSNLLFQMFYGMPARIVNKEGIPIQGVLGFVGALLKIIRLTNPSHIAVLFDGEHHNPRSLLDPDYKANRVDYSQIPEEQSPFPQLPFVYAALNELKIPHAETTDCETDDWISAYVQIADESTNVVIASFDSDFFQLISHRVSVLRYRGNRTVIFTPWEFKQKFGVDPEQYADFKAMTGDTSDHIKGAPGIGPKTAASLLNKYGDLDRILASIDFISQSSVRTSIANHRDRLIRNRRLISLRHEVLPNLPFPIADLPCPTITMTTREVLQKIGL
ncbi:MAG: 5'-3' exonuclease [Ruminococcaceae bacterium]|nr:5'-3' exonuclease [Oscillospiraceae bacterium]